MEIREVIATLKEDYALRNSLKRKRLDVHEEVEDEIDDLEQSYISSYIIPELEKYAKELLKDLECETYLSILKDTNGDVRVSNEYVLDQSTNYGKDYLSDDSDNDSVEGTITQSEVCQSEQAADDANNDSNDTIKRSPSTGLCIWTSDTDFIQEKTASQTMTKAIIAAGVDKVVALNIPHDNDFLISKTKHPKYSSSQQPLSHGYLLNTHSSTDTKKRILERIFKDLHLTWRVEIPNY